MEQVDLPGDRLWTVAEAPYFLGVPVGTLYYWRCRGEGLMPEARSASSVPG